MNEIIKRACEEKSLLNALVVAAHMENDRAVKSAREHDGVWVTCFEAIFKRVMAHYGLHEAT